MVGLDNLWREFKETGSKVAKDKLLVEYSHIVKYTVQRLAVNLPPSVDRGDLYGAGILGLIKAVDSFDPERGFKFETFAGHKIRGAILDELRALDWVPRSVRQKARDLQKVFIRLENRLGRSPYDDEVCKELGMSIDEYEQMLSDVTPTTVISLDETKVDRAFSDSKEMRLIDQIEDPESANPYQVLGQEELKSTLKGALADLPENERVVVALYHYEELTLKEIGEVLNLTESRVSQLHSKAMIKLRSRLHQKLGD
ncbi:MAG: FliA/WhiG family RNA polymerase sigma factor [Chitinispirillales bacterium]|jgi:RNA polymerase sigma factor for flagellar operon FliA|nr:FliA/WhiG family RNA polymerase sigma factor [Chitinispirillales bacterium]